MSKRSRTSVARILRQSADIAVSAPMIASKRMAHVSAQHPGRAAASLSSMGAEKFTAFGSAWIGMTAAVAKSQLEMAFSLLPTFGGFKKPTVAAAGKRAFDLGVTALAGGIRPIHAQVKRNARSKR